MIIVIVTEHLELVFCVTNRNTSKRFTAIIEHKRILKMIQNGITISSIIKIINYLY